MRTGNIRMKKKKIVKFQEQMFIASEPKEEGGGKDAIKKRRPKQFSENTFSFCDDSYLL